MRVTIRMNGVPKDDIQGLPGLFKHTHTHSTIKKPTTKLPNKEMDWWFKNICSSSKESGFSFQHPQGSSQLSVTLDSNFQYLLLTSAGTKHEVCKHIGKMLRQINKIDKKLKVFLKNSQKNLALVLLPFGKRLQVSGKEASEAGKWVRMSSGAQTLQRG